SGTLDRRHAPESGQGLTSFAERNGIVLTALRRSPNKWRSSRKLARRAVVGVLVITVAVALAATARHHGPSDAAEHGLRLAQPGSPLNGGVRPPVAQVASRVER